MQIHFAPNTSQAPCGDTAAEEPGNRCPDFDADCAGVADHAKCAAGSVVAVRGEVIVLPPIIGFCPYVCGMTGRT